VKETLVDNDFYTIAKDEDKNRAYLVIKESYTDKETDINLINNTLAHIYEMPERFNLVLDLRLYDPRVKGGLFTKRMADIGVRLYEMNAGPQTHILNEILWMVTQQKYGIEPVPPAVTEDVNSREKIARFNTIEDADIWLDANGYPSE